MKLRDLLIGILLNLTCNLENNQLIVKMVTDPEIDIINVLTKILVDPRHEWPTNGAALALLQYTHLSVSVTDILDYLVKNKVKDLCQKFALKCGSKEAKKYLEQLLSIIESSLKKSLCIK